MRRVIMLVAASSGCGRFGFAVESSSDDGVDAGPAADVAAGGLLLHWQLDEGSGWTAADSAGDNAGSLVNMNPVSAWIAGPASPLGTALDFDGIDDVVIATAPDVGARDFTVTLWTQIHANIVDLAAMYDSRDAGGERVGFELRAEASSSEVRAICDFGPTAEGPTATVPTGTWVHLASTIDRSGSISLYVDGRLRGAVDISAYATVSLTPSEQRSYLGRNFGNAHFDGAIDDVRLYNRLLSAQEIAVLATPQ